MTRPSALLPFAVLAALVAPRAAHACAAAPPQGALVSIADESAVIVWDDATKTEHFIRRATFRAQVKDFGFLVPTPSKPELSEARDASFARLEDVIRPEVVQKHGLRIEPTMLLLMFLLRSRASSDNAAAPMAAAVRVLEEKRVAGYDAVVLEADDAGALAAWLKEHGYAQRPALAEWLTPYVQKKWKLTAFKVADGTPGEGLQTLGTNAVRMSFHTDRPFFPYREPRDQRESLPPSASTPRSLRVFFIGTSRASATVGEGTAFAGTTAWAGPFDAARAELPIAAPPGAWLTVFQDDSSPRPGTDELWFGPAKDQTPLKPPPTIVEVGNPIPIPLDLIALVGLIFWRVARRAKKRER